jgi:formylglycine-generating enzyme required for sulfatase activity
MAILLPLGLWAAPIPLWGLPPEGNRAIAVQGPSRPAAAQETRVALVIGNGAYADAPLRNPVHDARAIKAALESCRFQVTLLTDASKRDMENAIRAFGDRIRDGAVGLFYFAGHGVQVKGINYLVPVGANLEREDEVVYQAVEAGQVLDKMDAAKNKLNIMILDACRNNPFSRSWRGGGDRGLAQVNAPTGSFIAFATAPGREAADGAADHGLYTEALLAQLREPNLELEKVFKKTREKVMAASQGQQTPWESNSTVGDFYFNPLARPEAAPDETQTEASIWAAIQNSREPKDFDTFLDRFPNGPHAEFAHVKAKNLRMPAVTAGARDPLAEPWKLLQRVKLETRDEYAARIAALGPVKIATAVVSEDNYDVDAKRLEVPILPDRWAVPYLHQDHLVLELDRDQVRRLLNAPGTPAVTARFKVVDGSPEPGSLTMVTTAGTFTPGQPGSDPVAVPVASAAALPADPPRPAPAAARPPVPKPIPLALPDPGREAEAKALRGSYQNWLGMTFAPIPAGRFMMGDTAGDADEKPAHAVAVATPFALQTTHVTVKQWKAFVDATGYVTEVESRTVVIYSDAYIWSSTKVLPYTWRDPGYFRQDADHPVVCITWNDTQAFLAWLNRQDPGRGYRLPTEAEWEYACRAGTVGPRPGELDAIAWYSSTSGRSTHPVARKAPNPWGLYDMLGNATQWCQDWYEGTYYSRSPEVDPQGPAAGTMHVTRGAGWYLSAGNARSGYRNYYKNYIIDDTGFRVAMSSAPGSKAPALPRAQ